MTNRRTILESAGVALATLAGTGSSTALTDDGFHSGSHESSGADDVSYVRNVEEVRGHLTSALKLLGDGRTADAALHAGHPQEYFGAILPPVRDRAPMLARRLRARLKEASERVRSDSVTEYETYVNDEVVPLLEQAVETVVEASVRESTSFDVRVMNALAGRIAEEYDAAVTSDGSIQKDGEYWDGRGFLVRIEARHETVSSALGGTGSDTLSKLRSDVETVAPPSVVQQRTLRFQFETAAAAELSSATVERREDALDYVRNVEEVHGHLHAATQLAAVDDSTASLHASHPGDYVTTVLPPVQRQNSDLATDLFDELLAVDDKVSALGTEAFESYVDGTVRPLLNRARNLVVPSEYDDDTSFDAALTLALARRLEDEYAAAVTDEEVIELYGEYWDARGFLSRIEARFDDFESDLDSETRTRVAEELDVLRTELESTATPDDVAGSVAALEAALGDLAQRA